MNENTLNVTSGDTKTTFGGDLTGFQFGGLSDFVSEGRYELICDDARLEPRKDGMGVNVRVDWRVVGPQCREVGKHLISFHPVPVGSPADQDFRKKAFYLNAMTASIFSWAGKFGTGLPNPGAYQLNGEMLKGKHAFGSVIEDSYNGQPIGAIKGYMEKGEYEKNPGPVGDVRGSASNVTTNATSADTKTATKTQAQPQAQTGGNGAAASDPVTDFLGM